MLREQARPVNDADTAILDAIDHGDTLALQVIRHRVPTTLLSFLEQLLQDDGKDDVANWRQLADALRDAGLTASALAAYGRLSNVGDADVRADAYASRAEIERKLHMEWAAAADQRAANRLRGIQNTGGLLLELEDGDLMVQTAHSDPTDYARIVASLPDSPLLNDPLRDPTLTKRYCQTPPPDGGVVVDDCSFFVLDGNGRPILQVEADARGDRYLGCRETWILLTRLDEAHPQIAQAESLAVRQLRIILEWSGCSSAMFEARPGVALSPLLWAWITNTDAGVVSFTAAWIDLSASEEAIERGYRDAHRQSLRWGRKNIRIVKTTTPDPVQIDLYREVHFDCGRWPAVSTDILATYLDEGRFNLYIGYFEEKPVVALLSSRHGSTTYYWASAKVIIGNKPLGHVVLHQAIMDAKAEGQKRFDFGLLHTAEGFDAKLRNISLYKRGFASHTEKVLRYTVWV